MNILRDTNSLFETLISALNMYSRTKIIINNKLVLQDTILKSRTGVNLDLKPHLTCDLWVIYRYHVHAIPIEIVLANLEYVDELPDENCCVLARYIDDYLIVNPDCIEIGDYGEPLRSLHVVNGTRCGQHIFVDDWADIYNMRPSSIVDSNVKIIFYKKPISRCRVIMTTDIGFIKTEYNTIFLYRM